MVPNEVEDALFADAMDIVAIPIVPPLPSASGVLVADHAVFAALMLPLLRLLSWLENPVPVIVLAQ